MTHTATDVEIHGAFNARLATAAEGTACAHAVFSEVTDNDVAYGGIVSTMDAIYATYMELGDMLATIGPDAAMERLAQTVEHALVTVMALGMALGAANALADADTVIPDTLDGIAWQ